jgi:hypothetical protein
MNGKNREIFCQAVFVEFVSWEEWLSQRRSLVFSGLGV